MAALCLLRAQACVYSVPSAPRVITLAQGLLLCRVVRELSCLRARTQIMELARGGELFAKLCEIRYFPEDSARFYWKQLMEARPPSSCRALPPGLPHRPAPDL